MRWWQWLAEFWRPRVVQIHPLTEDQVKAMTQERLVRPPICPPFSLAPGSVNRVYYGQSGWAYNGTEMG